MDFRIEAFLVGEITVASMIAVSVDGIVAFAIESFAMLMGALPISASMALDIQIITPTTTRIIIHSRTTTRISIRASINPGPTEDLQQVK
jgi:hypothetical protein